MSAIFNGSSAYLLTANNLVGGSTPVYPILYGGWVKLANVTAPLPVMFMSDNAALGSIPVRVVEEGELSPDVSIPVRGLP